MSSFQRIKYIYHLLSHSVRLKQLGQHHRIGMIAQNACLFSCMRDAAAAACRSCDAKVLHHSIQREEWHTGRKGDREIDVCLGNTLVPRSLLLLLMDGSADVTRTENSSDPTALHRLRDRVRHGCTAFNICLSRLTSSTSSAKSERRGEWCKS